MQWEISRRKGVYLDMKYTSYEELPVVLTVYDLADVLGISKNTAYDFVHSEQIKYKRVNNQIRIPKECLKEFLTN